MKEEDEEKDEAIWYEVSQSPNPPEAVPYSTKWKYDERTELVSRPDAWNYENDLRNMELMHKLASVRGRVRKKGTRIRTEQTGIYLRKAGEVRWQC